MLETTAAENSAHKSVKTNVFMLKLREALQTAWNKVEATGRPRGPMRSCGQEILCWSSEARVARGRTMCETQKEVRAKFRKFFIEKAPKSMKIAYTWYTRQCAKALETNRLCRKKQRWQKGRYLHPE
eukprot:3340139-Pleurochrysis_carterae.AAC.2